MIDREQFRAWLRRRAAKGQSVGTPRTATACPLACFLTASDATLETVRVGVRTVTVRDARGIERTHDLPAWASHFARLVDARVNTWPVSARSGLAILADVEHAEGVAES